MSSLRIRKNLGRSLGWIFCVLFSQGAIGSPAFPLFDHSGDGAILIHELNCVACHEGKVNDILPPVGAPNLSEAGSRLTPNWIRAFLIDPEKVSPGSSHPVLLGDLPPSETKARAEALAQYLSMLKSTRVPEESLRGNAETGQQLFDQVGCVACHGQAASMNLQAKYSNARGLADLLENPRRLNPHGRMPSLGLNAQEALDVASALVKGGPPRLPDNPKNDRPGVYYQTYAGDWDRLPDFEKLKPFKKGVVDNLSPTIAGLEDHFGVRYTGFLLIDKSGGYEFSTNSDDGSRFYVGDQLVVNNDGVHGGITKKGTISLASGKHAFTLLFFDKEGGEHNHVSWSGPGFSEKALGVSSVTQSPDEHPGIRPSKKNRFIAEFDKVKLGKQLFSELNCAACHAVDPNGKLHRPEGILGPPPALAEMKEALGRGCLSSTPIDNAPHFRLLQNQTKAIVAALGKSSAKPKPAEILDQTLLAYQCYACHKRNGIGGPTDERDTYFLSSQQAMGPEGRLPPHLNGVGAKLKSSWLKEVISKGTKVRPYMTTRMPSYGPELAVRLTERFIEVDKPKETSTLVPKLPQREALKKGRELIGSKGMACVSCHTFAGIPSLGVQGMDLTVMNKRLRFDWLSRYLLDPTSLRPGTRMPSFWPQGKSTKPDVLDGDTTKQIAAIYRYLSLEEKAPVPSGLARSGMQLTIDDEARLYRNFIDGAGARAIGVGYPGEVNLAWDANHLRPALFWHGPFMDASRHWSGRGQGFQAPDGFNRLTLPDGPPFAILTTPGAPWPKVEARPAGFRFGGYLLDKQRRPTFRYSFGELKVEDFFKERHHGDDEDFALDRIVTITGKMVADLYFRIGADGSSQRIAKNIYKCGDLTVHLSLPAGSKVVSRAEESDILVPIPTEAKKFVIKQTFEW
ncbi:MAG: c-type cytochrome [Opitutales bacterium]|nr:c-type cytochrome [Opitutales bacterium]